MEHQLSSPKLSCQTTSLSSSRLGPLSTLPFEIRDKIYSLVFFAGHISLTRVSKALHTDTKDALMRHGIYRLHVQYWFNPYIYCWTVACNVPASVLANVQNLRITIDFRLQNSPFRPDYRPSGILSEDEIVYYHQGSWTLKSNSSASILPDPNAIDLQNNGLWTLQSPSLRTILQKLPFTMKRHNYCDIIHLYSGYVGIPYSAYRALELFQSFKTVLVQFNLGPERDIDMARHYLQKAAGIRNNFERTMKALGRRQDLEKGPDLTITQRFCYYCDGWRHETQKSWGDEPGDEDYGLGEWTAEKGRIWPIRNR